MLRRTLLALATILNFPGALAQGQELQKEIHSEEDNYDLIVIGSGAAGLCSAITAKQNGLKRVLVLEKAKFIGGHSIISEGTANFLLPTDPPDVRNEWIKQTLETGGYLANKKMVETFVDRSTETFYWLKSLGINWKMNRFIAVTGELGISTNDGTERSGSNCVRALLNAARKEKVEIKLGTGAVQILLSPVGAVCGVLAKSKEQVKRFNAKAVVIATGGFTANVGMRMRYDSRLDSNFNTTSNPFRMDYDGSTGDGIMMAEVVGAQTVGMKHIELIPLNGGRVLNYVGGDIYVDSSGSRFVDETAKVSTILEKFLDLPDNTMWVITDSQSEKNSSFEGKLISGVIQRADTVDEMARKMNVSAIALSYTLERYNNFVEKGFDSDFGKKIFTQKINKPPYYFGKERFDIHTSLGGILTDVRARVIGKDDKPIYGLYAAGETVGGIEGAARQGGNALTIAFVFGRISGEEAAKYIENLR